MKVIIDRFESDFALCEKEDRTMIKVLTSLIPKGAKEGTTLEINGLSYTLLEDVLKTRDAPIKALVEDLWE